MSYLLPLVVVLLLSSASVQCNIVDGAKKEMAGVIDPLDKSVAYIAFSQCKHVKNVLGVSYDQYDKDDLDMSALTLNFITQEINVKIKLSAISQIVKSEWFKPENGLIIYIHGFTDDPSKGSYTNINEAFLAQGNYNIFALDASSLIKWLYLRSSTMVRYIGEELGVWLATVKQAGLASSSIHLIGHSLGSHIAGFAAKTFFAQTGSKVGRISSLDPAGPCFADVNSTLRLNKTDADFVDVIHTDAGVYGLDAVVGDVDYYPNSGSEQPGCLLQTCSHSRAWEYYAESVRNPTAFPAVSCDSWKDFKNGKCDYNNTSYMGFASKPGTSGSYYLQTADKSPYALNTDGIKYKNNQGIIKNIGDALTPWS